jgi:lantibiotic modifying enzyme
MIYCEEETFSCPNCDISSDVDNTSSKEEFLSFNYHHSIKSIAFCDITFDRGYKITNFVAQSYSSTTGLWK